MNEEHIRVEIQHLVNSLGFWHHHPADTGPTESARPDIFCLNPRGVTVVIEVKRIEPKVKIEPWFDPANISDGQRQWLDNWYFKLGLGFIGIGTIEAPRRLWIIPWQAWVEMEVKLCEKDTFFRINLSNLDEEFELERIAGGWKLPLYHPLLPLALETTRPPRSTHEWNEKKFSFRFTPKKEEPQDGPTT